jgi:predicted membrane protein
MRKFLCLAFAGILLLFALMVFFLLLLLVVPFVLLAVFFLVRYFNKRDPARVKRVLYIATNVLRYGWGANMKKFIYRTIAGILLLLAVLGVFLPLLPTVPFVLLAVFFLVKSSKKDLVRIKRVPYIGKILYPYVKRVAKWNTQQPSSST